MSILGEAFRFTQCALAGVGSIYTFARGKSSRDSNPGWTRPVQA